MGFEGGKGIEETRQGPRTYSVPRRKKEETRKSSRGRERELALLFVKAEALFLI
jgi:hypothetical protein